MMYPTPRYSGVISALMLAFGNDEPRRAVNPGTSFHKPKSLMSIFGLWKDVPGFTALRGSSFPNASISAEITPEYLGVGYIIGPRISGVLVAGGILSYLVLIPLI